MPYKINKMLKNNRIIKVPIQRLVRFLAVYRIKPHAPLLGNNLRQFL